MLNLHPKVLLHISRSGIFWFPYPNPRRKTLTTGIIYSSSDWCNTKAIEVKIIQIKLITLTKKDNKFQWRRKSKLLHFLANRRSLHTLKAQWASNFISLNKIEKTCVTFSTSNKILHFKGVGFQLKNTNTIAVQIMKY